MIFITFISSAEAIEVIRRKKAGSGMRCWPMTNPLKIYLRIIVVVGTEVEA